jgi:hypothetical protein
MTIKKTAKSIDSKLYCPLGSNYYLMTKSFPLKRDGSIQNVPGPVKGWVIANLATNLLHQAETIFHG